MKYAKLKDGKVLATQIGIRPEGEYWVEVKKMWSIPTDYPASFYSPVSTKPRLAVVGDEVHETWDFVLKEVELIKNSIFQSQKEKRQKAQLGSFMVGELEVTLKDREDSLIIASLTAKTRKFKVGQGQWVTLTGADVQALKDAHDDHVQAAYDTEESENTALAAITTHAELNTYLEPSE